MSNTIRIFIPGQPRGKERARSTRSGRHYTPVKTAQYERLVGTLGKLAMKGRLPTDGPVELNLMLIYAIPGSWPKWKKELAIQGEIRPTVKPDRDNVEKSITDGLNQIAWLDDCQVVDGRIAKFYGNEPGVLAEVTPINAYPAQMTRKPVHDEQMELVE